MWIRRRPKAEDAAANAPPGSLKEAVRQTRIEIAEKSSVVVDLRDAELARLELLSEALDPLFAEIPKDIELFDRGISRGDTPRLWIDAIAHVVMGRDKRRYRFVQDTRYGRNVLAEGNDIVEVAVAIRHYVASRIIEREQALAADGSAAGPAARQDTRRFGRRRAVRAFLFGIVVGCLALFAAAWFVASLPGP